jgi:hypothetical protein
MISKFMKRALSATALSVAIMGAATSANALTFVLRDLTPGGMSAAQLGAFNAAANIWSTRLSDPVTIYLNINFRNDGNNGILGSTGSTYAAPTYAAVRSALTADRTSAADFTAVASLQTGNFLAFQATNLDLTTRFDNDTNNPCAASGPITPCSDNNEYLGITTANAKALGFSTGTNAANPDGSISFNGAYASQFDFDRSDGIGALQYDFVSIAAHEIGHALGFVSGVDDADYCSPLSAGRCAQFGITGKYDLEQYATYSTLDLFRYSAPGVLDFRVGGSPQFSIDGGLTSIEGFSNGSFNGSDGYQASHFRPGPQNLMNPYGFRGVAVNPTAKDLLAFDVIGWNLAAVPEAPTWGMMIAGFGLVGGAMRRKAKAALATA